MPRKTEDGARSLGSLPVPARERVRQKSVARTRPSVIFGQKTEATVRGVGLGDARTARASVAEATAETVNEESDVSVAMRENVRAKHLCPSRTQLSCFAFDRATLRLEGLTWISSMRLHVFYCFSLILESYAQDTQKIDFDTERKRSVRDVTNGVVVLLNMRKRARNCIVCVVFATGVRHCAV